MLAWRFHFFLLFLVLVLFRFFKIFPDTRTIDISLKFNLKLGFRLRYFFNIKISLKFHLELALRLNYFLDFFYVRLFWNNFFSLFILDLYQMLVSLERIGWVFYDLSCSLRIYWPIDRFFFLNSLRLDWNVKFFHFNSFRLDWDFRIFFLDHIEHRLFDNSL